MNESPTTLSAPNNAANTAFTGITTVEEVTWFAVAITKPLAKLAAVNVTVPVAIDAAGAGVVNTVWYLSLQ